MKKIWVISPHSKDANSLWRCMGPLGYLARHSEGKIVLGTSDSDENCWDRLADVDILFLHRPCRPGDLTALQIARNLNIPVWVDFDDWLFDLPHWNQGQATYNNPGIQSIIAHCLAAADVVTCSTSALYDRFRLVNPNVVIVPNAYRSDLFPYRSAIAPPRQELFCWRGTNTHDGDLLSVLPAWKELAAPVHFFGFPAWQVLNEVKDKKPRRTSGQDPLLFFKHLYQTAPKVMLFPLKDCFFNRCKSNIAYIEALHAGALVVAPDLPEWKRPGVITYTPDDPQSFLDAANQTLAMAEYDHAHAAREAFDEMKKLYDIEQVNLIRLQIVSALTEGSFERNNRDPYDQLTALWALSQLKNLPMVPVSSDCLISKNLR